MGVLREREAGEKRKYQDSPEQHRNNQKLGKMVQEAGGGNKKQEILNLCPTPLPSLPKSTLGFQTFNVN